MNRPGRYATLLRFQARLEVPMIVLAFVWLALFIVEAVWGARRWMEVAGWVIWAAFIVEYVVGFLLAPDKWIYVRKNWLKAVALLAPALRMLRMVRVLRLARAARLARGARVLRIVSSLNRGMRALGRTLGRRGAPYVVALTLLVTLAGAAGMYAFENEPTGPQGFAGFADALWWTAMIMTTMGSAYWPQTDAGRVLCVLLSLYAFAVFGYVTALLASFFIGRDVETGGLQGKEVKQLAEEIRELRAALEARADTAVPSVEAATPHSRNPA